MVLTEGTQQESRNGQEEQGPLAAWREEMSAELEEAQQKHEEISLLIEQSQVEVNKLAQRNATITGHLQQVQTHFETMPREEIRSTYDSALEAQQRLFVMRGQLEKLESDQEYLGRLIQLQKEVLEMLEGGVPQEGNRPKSSYDMVELIIQAQEAERQRLSRQMHDGPAQALSNFILQTEIAMRLFDVNRDKARDELETLKGAATTTFQQVREFIFALRPMMLDDLGFIPTVKRYVESQKEQSGLDVAVRTTGAERRLESYLEVMIFRAIQEMLNNAMQHSQATEIRVQIDISGRDVRVMVEDNGSGFDTSVLDDEEDRKGMGLELIRERVEMLGGRFEVDSVPERGTRVILEVPAGG